MPDDPPLLRLRHSSAVTVAAMVAMIAGLSLATWAPLPSLAVLVIPLTVALWGWRAGTDAGPSGITVRAALGRRHVRWDQIGALVVDARGQVSARLTDGSLLPLTAARAADIAALIRAGGQELVAPVNGQ